MVVAEVCLTVVCLTLCAPVQAAGVEHFSADVTVWAVGKVRPNNTFIPKELLDDAGFVRVDEFLRAKSDTGGGCASRVMENVFCVGDIAATDSGQPTTNYNTTPFISLFGVF